MRKTLPLVLGLVLAVGLAAGPASAADTGASSAPAASTPAPAGTIGGMTLGADPLISATTVISHEKGRPLAGLIVRKESKGHGTNQYVEGLSNFKPGDPVAMVEDVVTTGGSLLKACERVKDAGLNVVAVCTVLDRGEGGREAIEAAGYQLRALFTRPELVELAKED